MQTDDIPMLVLGLLLGPATLLVCFGLAWLVTRGEDRNARPAPRHPTEEEYNAQIPEPIRIHRLRRRVIRAAREMGLDDMPLSARDAARVLYRANQIDDASGSN